MRVQGLMGPNKNNHQKQFTKTSNLTQLFCITWMSISLWGEAGFSQVSLLHLNACFICPHFKQYTVYKYNYEIEDSCVTFMST